MFWFYPQVVVYVPIFAYPRAETSMRISLPSRQEPEQEPYLQTWPYSNSYYGNYYES